MIWRLLLVPLASGRWPALAKNSFSNSSFFHSALLMQRINIRESSSEPLLIWTKNKKKKRLQKMHNDVVYIFQAGTNKLRQRTGFAGFVVGYHITGWKCAVMRDHRSVDRVVYGHLSMSDKRFLIVFDLGPPFSAIWISNLAKHHHRKRKTKNFMVFFLCAFVRSLYFFFLFLFDIIISH